MLRLLLRFLFLILTWESAMVNIPCWLQEGESGMPYFSLFLVFPCFSLSPFFLNCLYYMYSLFFFVFINYSDLFYDPVKLLPVNTVHISQCPALSYHSKSAFLCLYCSSLYLFITKKRAKKGRPKASS